MKADLCHVAAGMHARARDLRNEAEQLEANASAMDGLLLPQKLKLCEPRWFDFGGGIPLLAAARALADAIGLLEPEIQCNDKDYIDAGFTGEMHRFPVDAGGRGRLIANYEVPRGRVVAR